MQARQKSFLRVINLLELDRKEAAQTKLGFK